MENCGGILLFLLQSLRFIGLSQHWDYINYIVKLLGCYLEEQTFQDRPYMVAHHTARMWFSKHASEINGIKRG